MSSHNPSQDWDLHCEPVVENDTITDSETATCSLCGKPVLACLAHLHQGVWIGDCCWDERLRVTE